MPHPHPAVSAHGLTKRYGDLVAVDDLDLEVAPGTVMAILGPNGAGKTTTVRMIATLEAPTAGTVSVCGFDVRDRRRPDPHPDLAHRPVRRPRGQPHGPREPRAHGPAPRPRQGRTPTASSTASSTGSTSASSATSSSSRSPAASAAGSTSPPAS